MSKFTITLDQAKKWAITWRNNPPKELAKGHLIPVESLKTLIQTADVVSVRAYMGIDENKTQKLFFVGVNSDGKDLVDETHLIYDATEPCPTKCDPSSPFFKL
ncbi:hypothetical protein ACFSX9_04015 [Flavobacterium ardleyense]|uniref:Uncharacterized protein n=1 Tax=Flavobacterium ardleyense TaxID=2038737 RepID=A0ABW5Z6Z9_9FLAO